MLENAEPAVAVAPPCGACRTLRRRCVPGCVFAPYFTPEDFAAVHGAFGASNVSKMLEGIELPEQRRVAAATLVEEARARARDPTFGSISYLRILQEVNDKARAQVDEAREEIAREFGAAAAYEPVDVVAAADPAARREARAQVDAALKHAREQDARLRGVRKANEVRWREMQLNQQQQQQQQAGTGKHAGNGKGPDVIKRHRVSEQTMPMPWPGFPDERSRQQMAAAEAEREKALLTRQAAPANQNGHHLDAQHAEIEAPRVPEGYAHGQLHQQMSEARQQTAAAQQALREEAMRSVQAPAAAPPQHLDSAGQHAAGKGQPRHAGDAAANRTPGRGSNSVLLEAMMQLAGAGDGDRYRDGDGQHQQQHLVPQHDESDHVIAQGMLQLQELLDMAALARKQKKSMTNGVMTETGQWDAAARGAREQGVMTTTTQQIPTNTWQHQDPATQYAWMRDGPHQETPQQMEDDSAAELAKTTGNMSQKFASASAQQYQYHDPAAAHRASPWLQQMADAQQQQQQPAAASASQVASEQDMLLLLQQHQVAAAEELLMSAGGARQFGNLAAAQYDDTELTLGYGYGHPDMHQQVAAAGQVAGVQQHMNSRHGHATAAVIAEREMMHQQQLAAGAQHHQQQHAQKGLDIALGNGHPDAATQAMMQELADVLELDRRQKMMRRQGVTTEMAQWDAAARVTREPDVMTTMTQRDADAAWLQELLEQSGKASSPELDKRLETISWQAEARHGQKQLGISLGNGHPDGSTHGILQAQELFAMDERTRRMEMLMRQIAAEGRARDQEMMAQQAAAAAAQQQQYSGTQLDITLGNDHPNGSTQGILQAQEPFAMDERTRKLEMLMRQIAAEGRARDQEMIAQQAAAAQRRQQQQQHPVAQYSGTELGISLGQGQGHPYWHQPTVQQMLPEKQLPTVQQMLQEQQLADAVGFGRHQPNTTSTQHGEHGGGAGVSTMAFLSPGSAKDAPFFVDQQPHPQVQTATALGLQMDSSLPPLPASLSQLHAQVSHQQRTDGGGQGLDSDLAAYLHYESLSRQGLGGNGSLQQG